MGISVKNIVRACVIWGGGGQRPNAGVRFWLTGKKGSGTLD